MNMIELNKKEIEFVAGGAAWDDIGAGFICGAVLGYSSAGCIFGMGCNLAFFMAASRYDFGKKLNLAANVFFAGMVTSLFVSSVIGSGIGGAVSIYTYYRMNQLSLEDGDRNSTVASNGNSTVV